MNLRLKVRDLAGAHVGRVADQDMEGTWHGFKPVGD